MQAPLSLTASGEHILSGLSPSVSPLLPGPLLTVGTMEVADGIGLAHDAGNLLGAIRLYCDLLALPGVLRSEHRHYADELRQLTTRSGSLIDRLLRPARSPEAALPTVHGREMDNGGGQYVAERIRLSDAVLECRGMLEPLVGAGSLLIAVEAGASGDVAVPREALERILLNLIKNAVEARTTGEEREDLVAVRVRSVAAWGPARVEGIAVSVEDRGRGMDGPALRAALTGIGDKGRAGRGIGLSVVRELTARTGGELRMRSRTGQGTTVEIVWAAVPRDGAESG